jgi:hypothetical protein
LGLWTLRTEAIYPKSILRDILCLNIVGGPGFCLLRSNAAAGGRKRGTAHRHGGPPFTTFGDCLRLHPGPRFQHGGGRGCDEVVGASTGCSQLRLSTGRRGGSLRPGASDEDSRPLPSVGLRQPGLADARSLHHPATVAASPVPIDGVGLQMHIPMPDADMPTIAADIAANISRLTALGLQIQITELDVSLPVDSHGQSRSDDLTRQAEVYRGIVRACLNNPGCTAIQTWGFTDKILLDWIAFARRSRTGAGPLIERISPSPRTARYGKSYPRDGLLLIDFFARPRMWH